MVGLFLGVFLFFIFLFIFSQASILEQKIYYKHINMDNLFLLDPGMSVQRPKYRPIDQQALEAARKVREKEIKMYNVLREIGAYALYLWVLMILSFGNRDPNSFYIRETFINNYIKPGDLWVDFNTVSLYSNFLATKNELLMIN